VVSVNPTEEIAKPTKQILPLPNPIDQVAVTWIVVVPEDQPGVVWFALTPQQYENLAKNTAETIRWVTEAESQLEHYRDE